MPRKKQCVALTCLHGFTVIELLVVLAVIALLAALLFPVFAAAREKGKQAVCASNLHQIGTACALYAQDFDGWEVPLKVQYTSAPTYVYWPSLLNPYTAKDGINNAGIFHCPSSGETQNGWFAPLPQFVDPAVVPQGKTTYCGVVDGDPSDHNYPGKVEILSYSRNVMFYSKWRTPGWTSGLQRFGFNGTKAAGEPSVLSVSDAQVEDPAGTISIFDSMVGAKYSTPQTAANNTCTGGTASMVQFDDEYDTDHYKNSQSVKAAYRHSGGFNAIQADGHARWYAYGSTTPCDWSIQADPYPSDPQSVKDSCAKK